MNVVPAVVITLVVAALVAVVLGKVALIELAAVGAAGWVAHTYGGAVRSWRARASEARS